MYLFLLVLQFFLHLVLWRLKKSQKIIYFFIISKKDSEQQSKVEIFIFDIILIQYYFKDRKFSEHKVSRDRKFAEFRGFKFREFYFVNKIYRKNFRDFLKMSIFNGNNFREWLGKMKKIFFQIFFFQSYHFFLVNQK